MKHETIILNRLAPSSWEIGFWEEVEKLDKYLYELERKRVLDLIDNEENKQKKYGKK